jgi:hypothetical protein
MLSFGLSRRPPEACSGLIAGAADGAIAGRPLTNWNKKGTLALSESNRVGESDHDAGSTKYLAAKARCGMSLSDSAAAATLMDDSAIMDFLLSYVGKFDLYVEDHCPAYVRYCFEEPMDAAIFRSRFEPRSEPFRLAG